MRKRTSVYPLRIRCGKGAAMRIAPAGLFFHDSPDLYEQARASAFVTHPHPVGVDGAAVLAWAVAQAEKLAPQEPFLSEHFSQGLVDFARTPQIRDKIVLVRTLIAEDVPASDAARCLRRDVAVHKSLPSAIYSFLRHSARRGSGHPGCDGLRRLSGLSWD